MSSYISAFLSGNLREYIFWNTHKAYLLNRLNMTKKDEPNMRFFRWFHIYGISRCSMTHDPDTLENSIYYSSNFFYKEVKNRWYVFKSKIPLLKRIKQENIPFFIIVHELVHVMQYKLGYMRRTRYGFFFHEYAYHSCLTGKVTPNIHGHVMRNVYLETYVTLPHEYDANVIAGEIIIEMQEKGMI